MSGAITAAVVVGAAATAYSAKKQSDAQKKAQRSAEAAALQQEKRAKDQAKQADMEFNRANQKTPDLAGIMKANQRAEGAGSTMLTGPQGVDSSSLTLGKSTLLGG